MMVMMLRRRGNIKNEGDGGDMLKIHLGSKIQQREMGSIGYYEIL